VPCRWAGFFVSSLLRPPAILRGVGTLTELSKENLTVPDKIQNTNVARRAARIGISLDGWAVALALGLALLVWLGFIKRVPW
jgi:hypothetical protein